MPTQTLTIITPPNQPPTPSHWILLIGPHSSSQTPFCTVLHILSTETRYTVTVEQNDTAKLETVDAAATSPECCLVVCEVPKGKEGCRLFGALEWALAQVQGCPYTHSHARARADGQGCLWIEVLLSVLAQWGWVDK